MACHADRSTDSAYLYMWYIYIYIHTVYVYIHIHEWMHTHMYTYICNACVDRCGQVGGSQTPWSGKIQLVSPTEAINSIAEKLWQFGHLFYVLKKHILRGSKQILHDQFPQQSDFSTFLSGVSMIFPCALTQETIVFFFLMCFFLSKIWSVFSPSEDLRRAQQHAAAKAKAKAAASILLFLKLFDVFFILLCVLFQPKFKLNFNTRGPATNLMFKSFFKLLFQAGSAEPGVPVPAVVPDICILCKFFSIESPYRIVCCEAHAMIQSYIYLVLFVYLFLVTGYFLWKTTDFLVLKGMILCLLRPSSQDTFYYQGMCVFSFCSLS